MSLAAEVAAAASEAQGYLAQIQGMAPSGDNFVGPDGKLYTMVFASLDGAQVQAGGFDMASHGYGAKSFVVATATRAQFGAVPLAWRQKKGTRLIPAPSTEVLILSVNTDDPLHYVFALALRQPA